MSHFILIEIEELGVGGPNPKEVAPLIEEMFKVFNVRAKVTNESASSLERFAIEPEDGPDEGDDTPIKL